MSRIGKKSIIIPEGVTITVNKDGVEMKGKNATLTVPMLESIKVVEEDGKISVSQTKVSKQANSNWGTMRALIQNAVNGSVEDYKKKLIIEGVGYRANIEGTNLVLGLGYSHPINFPLPDGIKIEVEKNTILISGPDKASVGEAAAKIRRFRKPEPYKGKGIRYDDEVVRRKQGKKAGTV